MNFHYTSASSIPRVDPNLDPFSVVCLGKLRDWADSVEDPGSARFDKDIFGVGGPDAEPSAERHEQ